MKREGKSEKIVLGDAGVLCGEGPVKALTVDLEGKEVEIKWQEWGKVGGLYAVGLNSEWDRRSIWAKVQKCPNRKLLNIYAEHKSQHYPRLSIHGG